MDAANGGRTYEEGDIGLIDSAELEKAVIEAVGILAADWPLSPEEVRGGEIELDPFIDEDDRAYFRSQAAGFASEVAFRHRNAPCGAHDLAVEVSFNLEDLMEDCLEQGRMHDLDTIAEAVAAAIEGEPERFSSPFDHIDPIELGRDLRDRFGLYYRLPVDSVLEQVLIPTTLIIGTRADAEGDCHASRHALLHSLRAIEGECEMPVEYETAALVESSSLSWLCRTQGTTLSAVVAGQAPGMFADSLRDAIEEDGVSIDWGWPSIGMQCTMELPGYLEATAASLGGMEPAAAIASIPSGSELVLFDPVNGCGCSAPIKIERPIEVHAADVVCAMADHPLEKWGGFWTTHGICGYVPEVFEKRLDPSSEAPTRDLSPASRGRVGL